jgi:hypothetical protein
MAKSGRPQFGAAAKASRPVDRAVSLAERLALLAQNFAVEHEIGGRLQKDPNDLPAPKTGPITTNRSLTVPFDG